MSQSTQDIRSSRVLLMPATDIPAKTFFMNILNAMALGIVVALIPNAILGVLLKAFANSSSILTTLAYIATTVQFSACLLIGFIAGNTFNFGALKSACLALVGFISSGNLKFVDAVVNGNTTKILQIAGIGDILNVLLALSIACYLTLLIGNKFGSLLILLQPIVIGVFVSFIGYETLPYVSMVTKAFASLISQWTNVQPALMTTLIAVSFCFAIASPLSSVGLALITGVSGLAAGAANIGCSMAGIYLIIASYRSNSIGITIALLFGASKIMMPNLVRKPKLFLPMLALAAVAGFASSFWGILGDKQTAGFGYASLIGPLKSYELMAANGMDAGEAWFRIFGAYALIPIIIMLIAHVFLLKVGFYKHEDFKFNAAA